MPRCSPSYHLVFSLTFAFLATTTVSFAQVKSSTINVVVTDSTGARVPDVRAEVVEEATNQKFTGRTNNVGELTVPYLPAGRYTVSIRKEGFRPYIQTGLQLGGSQTAVVEASLQVGQNQQVVNVSSSAVQLQTESSSVQGATDRRNDRRPPESQSESALLRHAAVRRCSGQSQLLEHHRTRFIWNRLPVASSLFGDLGQWRREFGYRHPVGRRAHHGSGLQRCGSAAQFGRHPGGSSAGE